ncbi:MAG: YlxR family protein [Clostridia bacterium]|nr:YlxR family protein [Clostridia bacterium]
MTYIPIRMCVACREHRPQNELIRIICDENNASLVIDDNKKRTGRGAYICRDGKCVSKAHKKHILERNLACCSEEEIYRRVEEML